MVEQINRYELRNRYVFKGKLVMQTAFHIGGGKATLSHSDSPVVLTPTEEPFIPGSSFKGALRSTVEKLVPALPAKKELFSCGLIELSDEALEIEEAQAKQNKRVVCSTIRQREIALERREHSERAEQINAQALKDLCNTCQLFGSPFAASRISINDLYVSKKEWSGIVEVRDGVAIDRDSERARDRLKYDYEVVPASAVFDLEITLENATDQDLQLICVGVSEFVHGFGTIGGKRSRGLGVCLLNDLKISALELVGKNVSEKDRNTRLRNYLLRREFSSESTGEEFLNKYISTIFE